MSASNNSDFLVIGHRGARGHAPENTLLALDTGILLGAHWVEFDVQLHPEGALLVFHDLTLDRTTNGKGPLSQISPPCADSTPARASRFRPWRKRWT